MSIINSVVIYSDGEQQTDKPSITTIISKDRCVLAMQLSGGQIGCEMKLNHLMTIKMFLIFIFSRKNSNPGKKMVETLIVKSINGNSFGIQPYYILRSQQRNKWKGTCRKERYLFRRQIFLKSDWTTNNDKISTYFEVDVITQCFNFL